MYYVRKAKPFGALLLSEYTPTLTLSIPSAPRLLRSPASQLRSPAFSPSSPSTAFSLYDSTAFYCVARPRAFILCLLRSLALRAHLVDSFPCVSYRARAPFPLLRTSQLLARCTPRRRAPRTSHHTVSFHCALALYPSHSTPRRRARARAGHVGTFGTPRSPVT